MRTLVTGARGKVGVAAVAALVAAGHDVTATDLAPPRFDRPVPDAPPVDTVAYVQADLTAAGDVYPEAPTELRPVARPDASGIDCSKAERLLGWEPRRGWRDHLDDTGRPRDGTHPASSPAPWTAPPSSSAPPAGSRR